MRNAGRGMTLTEIVATVAVAMLVLGGLVVIFLSALINGGGSRRMQNNTQLRSVHQGLVMYGGGNGAYYPGLDAEGEPVAIDVEDRLKLLLDGDYFSPDYLVNPQDAARTPWESGPFTSDHYSYAVLQVPEAGGRHDEWRETLNTNAIVLSDRNTGTADAPASVHDSEQWRGGVVWNDNHVGFETTHRLDTAYGGFEHTDDHIFKADGDDDAYLIHSGN
ncbi:MAG: hypothetical protein WD316_13470 [Phycisphaeraceae bacterium]